MIPHAVLCLAYQRERMAYQNSSSNSYIVVQWRSDIICEITSVVISQMVSLHRGGSRIDLRGGLSIPRALARAKFYVLRPLLTSFPHTTSYTKKK